MNFRRSVNIYPPNFNFQQSNNFPAPQSHTQQIPFDYTRARQSQFNSVFQVEQQVATNYSAANDEAILNLDSVFAVSSQVNSQQSSIMNRRNNQFYWEKSKASQASISKASLIASQTEEYYDPMYPTMDSGKAGDLGGLGQSTSAKYQPAASAAGQDRNNINMHRESTSSSAGSFNQVPYKPIQSQRPFQLPDYFRKTPSTGPLKLKTSSSSSIQSTPNLGLPNSELSAISISLNADVVKHSRLTRRAIVPVETSEKTLDSSISSIDDDIAEINSSNTSVLTPRNPGTETAANNLKPCLKPAAAEGKLPHLWVFTDRVTHICEEYGFVGPDVFFQTSTVKGHAMPRVGDLALVEAESIDGMQFKWNAKKVHVIEQNNITQNVISHPFPTRNCPSPVDLPTMDRKVGAKKSKQSTSTELSRGDTEGWRIAPPPPSMSNKAKRISNEESSRRRSRGSPGPCQRTNSRERRSNENTSRIKRRPRTSPVQTDKRQRRRSSSLEVIKTGKRQRRRSSSPEIIETGKHRGRRSFSPEIIDNQILSNGTSSKLTSSSETGVEVSFSKESVFLDSNTRSEQPHCNSAKSLGHSTAHDLTHSADAFNTTAFAKKTINILPLSIQSSSSLKASEPALGKWVTIPQHSSIPLTCRTSNVFKAYTSQQSNNQGKDKVYTVPDYECSDKQHQGIEGITISNVIFQNEHCKPGSQIRISERSSKFKQYASPDTTTKSSGFMPISIRLGYAETQKKQQEVQSVEFDFTDLSTQNTALKSIPIQLPHPNLDPEPVQIYDVETSTESSFDEYIGIHNRYQDIDDRISNGSQFTTPFHLESLNDLPLRQVEPEPGNVFKPPHQDNTYKKRKRSLSADKGRTRRNYSNNNSRTLRDREDRDNERSRNRRAYDDRAEGMKHKYGNARQRREESPELRSTSSSRRVRSPRRRIRSPPPNKTASRRKSPCRRPPEKACLNEVEETESELDILERVRQLEERERRLNAEECRLQEKMAEIDNARQQTLHDLGSQPGPIVFTVENSNCGSPERKTSMSPQHTPFDERRMEKVRDSLSASRSLNCRSHSHFAGRRSRSSSPQLPTSQPPPACDLRRRPRVLTPRSMWNQPRLVTEEPLEPVLFRIDRRSPNRRVLEDDLENVILGGRLGRVAPPMNQSHSVPLNVNQWTGLPAGVYFLDGSMLNNEPCDGFDPGLEERRRLADEALLNAELGEDERHLFEQGMGLQFPSLQVSSMSGVINDGLPSSRFVWAPPEEDNFHPQHQARRPAQSRREKKVKQPYCKICKKRGHLERNCWFNHGNSDPPAT